MAIIPRYSSRALPPGAQSGLIESAQARGKAGAGLALAAGDAIIAGIRYKERRDARETAGLAENGRGMKAWKNVKSGVRSVDALKNRIAMGRETLARQAGLGDLADAAGLDAELAVARAGGVAAGRADGGAAGLAARRLAEFKGQAEKSLAIFKDRPVLKQRAGDIVASHARPYEARLLKMEAALRPVEEAARLDRALGLFAEAARLDPAGVDGYIGRGLKALEEAGAIAGLPGQEIAEKQDRFAGRAVTAAVRGLIERDPEGALARLEAGDFDDRFDKADLTSLRGEAKTAARAKGARESAAEGARRRALALDMEDHLAALAESGRGDETLEARARAELPEIEYAAFQADQAAARERYATRAEYAFMTPQAIEADIEAGASGDGSSDGDERDRTNAIRKEVRGEVLAARAADPAGWAMRDEDVAAAFAAAEENPDDPALARKATNLRLALQREMGIEQPRLLSEAERDALVEELEELSPMDLRARFASLQSHFNESYHWLLSELAGYIHRDAGLLAATIGDAPLAAMLARGMEKATKSGKHNPAPRLGMIRDLPRTADGKINIGALNAGNDYVIRLANSGAIVRPEGNALTLVAVHADDGSDPTDDEPAVLKSQDGVLRMASVNESDEEGAGPIAQTTQVDARHKKHTAMTNWQKLAGYGGPVPGGWKELPKTADGRIDRDALNDRQIYHIIANNGSRSAWRWNEAKRAFMPFRGREIAFSVDGMHELIGAPVKQVPDGRPIYNMEQDRVNAINWNSDAVFEITDNPDADDSYRMQDIATADYAKAIVLENVEAIERLAGKYSVDPQLVKAIMYREQAAGPAQPAADSLGISETLSPMGFNPTIWSGLGIDRESASSREDNIRAAILLIRRIQDRILDPTPEKIATLYNGLMMETVSNYGALVGRYYRESPWLLEDDDPQP